MESNSAKSKPKGAPSGANSKPTNNGSNGTNKTPKQQGGKSAPANDNRKITSNPASNEENPKVAKENINDSEKAKNQSGNLSKESISQPSSSRQGSKESETGNSNAEEWQVAGRGSKKNPSQKPQNPGKQSSSRPKPANSQSRPKNNEEKRAPKKSSKKPSEEKENHASTGESTEQNVDKSKPSASQSAWNGKKIIALHEEKKAPQVPSSVGGKNNTSKKPERDRNSKHSTSPTTDIKNDENPTSNPVKETQTIQPPVGETSLQDASQVSGLSSSVNPKADESADNELTNVGIPGSEKNFSFGSFLLKTFNGTSRKKKGTSQAEKSVSSLKFGDFESSDISNEQESITSEEKEAPSQDDEESNNLPTESTSHDAEEETSGQLSQSEAPAETIYNASHLPIQSSPAEETPEVADNTIQNQQIPSVNPEPVPIKQSPEPTPAESQEGSAPVSQVKPLDDYQQQPQVQQFFPNNDQFQQQHMYSYHPQYVYPHQHHIQQDNQQSDDASDDLPSTQGMSGPALNQYQAGFPQQYINNQAFKKKPPRGRGKGYGGDNMYYENNGQYMPYPTGPNYPDPNAYTTPYYAQPNMPPASVPSGNSSQVPQSQYMQGPMNMMPNMGIQHQSDSQGYYGVGNQTQMPGTAQDNIYRQNVYVPPQQPIQQSAPQTMIQQQQQQQQQQQPANHISYSINQPPYVFQPYYGYSYPNTQAYPFQQQPMGMNMNPMQQVKSAPPGYAQNIGNAPSTGAPSYPNPNQYMQQNWAPQFYPNQQYGMHPPPNQQQPPPQQGSIPGRTDWPNN